MVAYCTKEFVSNSFFYFLCVLSDIYGQFLNYMYINQNLDHETYSYLNNTLVSKLFGFLYNLKCVKGLSTTLCIYITLHTKYISITFVKNKLNFNCANNLYNRRSTVHKTIRATNV